LTLRDGSAGESERIDFGEPFWMNALVGRRRSRADLPSTPETPPVWAA
jgi:hypothetical protein